jgi:hypothetical protein
VCLAQSTHEALLGGMDLPNLLKFHLKFGSLPRRAARSCKSVSKPTLLACSLDARFRICPAIAGLTCNPMGLRSFYTCTHTL